MFSSLLSPKLVDPNAPNFHSVTSRYSENELFGELDSTDTSLLASSSGFITETQTWYIIADDGTSIMCQTIHSSVGVWFPTIQFTCKVANPTKGVKVWKSINVSNFVTPVPVPGLDKRSSKADEFSVIHSASNVPNIAESYIINAKLGKDLQVFLDIKRPTSIPGWKIGKGPEGGYSYFGTDTKKADGYVIHRFWPRTQATGQITIEGKVQSVKGSGMFVHAIQGMRPNLVASAWNFAHFQSDESGGVSAIQMEFTTQEKYGKRGSGSGGVVVNIGSLVVGGKLAAVTAETKWPGEESERDTVVSRAVHTKKEPDSDTGYSQPTEIEFEWKAPSILSDAPGEIEAKLHVDLGTLQSPKGLIEKVDVLAEIPYVIKMAVNYVAGAKPYIYQWINPAKLSIKGPEALSAGLSSGLEVSGTLYNEATFIST